MQIWSAGMRVRCPASVGWFFSLDNNNGRVDGCLESVGMHSDHSMHEALQDLLPQGLVRLDRHKGVRDDVRQDTVPFERRVVGQKAGDESSVRIF